MKFARVVLFFSVIAGLSLVAMFPATVGQGTALARDASQDGVHVEWLGHMFFRITSPSGLVVLTSPWVQNPDSPVTLDTVGRADIILVPDAHNDDIGQAFEIGVQTGATVIAPRLLGQRLVDQGLDSANVVAAQPGVTSRQGIQIVSVPSLHDNSMRDGDQTLNLGPPLGYFITFENGFTVYFAGSTFPTSDIQLWSMMYQPRLALITGQHGAVPFAQTVRLAKADNPALSTVIPIHIRAGAEIVQQSADEVARLGVPVAVFQPVIGQTYTY